MASATKALGDDVPAKSNISPIAQGVSSAATHYPSFIANPSVVQIRGNKGKFALIAADVNGIALYDISRENANLKRPWTLNTAFGEDIGATLVAGISLVEGPFGTPGNLEVVINGGGRWCTCGVILLGAGSTQSPKLLQQQLLLYFLRSFRQNPAQKGNSNSLPPQKVVALCSFGETMITKSNLDPLLFSLDRV